MKTKRRTGALRSVLLIYALAASFFFISTDANVGSLLILLSGIILLPLSSCVVDTKKEKRFLRTAVAVSVILLAVGIAFCINGYKQPGPETETMYCEGNFSLSEIPSFSDKAYVALNGNVPYFDPSQIIREPFERYSPLDGYGRCGVAEAYVCPEIMPDSPREAITTLKPSGWNRSEYDFIDGGLLYNRCHLIGFQLSGENSNERNVITGTRFLNVKGMLPFENEVASYVRLTGNGVYYRVTPVFSGEELVCRGVVIEAYSPSDGGEGICFNVFCYNEQPGVLIDHLTGDSCAGKTRETDADFFSEELQASLGKRKAPVFQQNGLDEVLKTDGPSFNFLLTNIDYYYIINSDYFEKTITML